MIARKFSRRRGSRAGYTLLEVLLSLILVSLVLLCVTMAVHVQMRVADTGRMHVEESQLARTLLHRIAEDLRGTLPYHTASQLSLGTSSGSQPTSTSSTSAASDSTSSDTSNSEATDDSGTRTLLSEGVPMVLGSLPGVYGGEDWLQMDLVRLARSRRATPSSIPGEEDPAALSGGDLKLVSYYLKAAPTAVSNAEASRSSGGLVRRELDRSVVLFHNGTRSQELHAGEALLAPEVIALEFDYTDGIEWFHSWDTAEKGALPLAIQIWLTLQTGQGPLDYSLIVDLPAARAGCLTEAAVISAGTKGTTNGATGTGTNTSSPNGTTNSSGGGR